ncbi:MAG: Stk1 family PASTA domain-containing Ser/Thr kinase [Bacilli bacterium]|nr:Stk1 family PASTA domain-containing Ser/Thr kinase [Bacilli bacterium]
MIIKGQKINDRYQIIRTIGEGGMANVYLAHDTILDRNVAVKILRGDLAGDEKFVRRFQREAISASSLSHPNIVEMYDVGEDDGRYFIVMEYIEGITLKSLIKRRGSLTLSEVLDIMIQLTSGLSCAHDSYIIHRDIKPQNVLILDDGRVKITDFGIAMAMNNNELTQTNSVMGSVHYLPPEQANGNKATIKSDIYSLGILMYELLVGKLPFKGDNAVEIAIKHMREEIPSVCEINPEIPQSVENIILKACAKNPKNRYENVREMQEDLRTCLDPSRHNEKRTSYQFPEFDEENSKKMSRSKKNKELSTDNTEVKKDKKMNKVLIIISSIAAFIVMAMIFLILIYPKIANSNKVIVPDVTGYTEEKAISTLEKAGLQIADSNTEKYDDKIDKGSIISTTPKSGRTVAKNTKITLIISKGSENMEIEDYTNKDFDIVKEALEELGILVSETYTDYNKDDGITDNIILSQDLKTGETFAKGDTIKFTVARVVVTYPDFVNEAYTKDQVQTFCDENKLVCTITEKTNDAVTAGTVYYQSQTTGKKVVSGASLTVYVAKATEKITVPDVKGKTLSAATSALESLGFVVSGTVNYEYSAAISSGYVISTSPSIGSQQTKGSTISLTVSKGVEPVVSD